MKQFVGSFAALSSLLAVWTQISYSVWPHNGVIVRAFSSFARTKADPPKKHRINLFTASGKPRDDDFLMWHLDGKECDGLLYHPEHDGDYELCEMACFQDGGCEAWQMRNYTMCFYGIV